MKTPSADNVKAVAILAGLIGVVFLGWKIYGKVKAVAETAEKVVTESLNPTSDKNIANRGVNYIVQTLTGEPGQTLGSKIYDWTH